MADYLMVAGAPLTPPYPEHSGQAVYGGSLNHGKKRIGVKV